MAHLKEWSCSGLGIGLASEKRQKSLFMMPGEMSPFSAWNITYMLFCMRGKCKTGALHTLYLENVLVGLDAVS